MKTIHKQALKISSIFLVISFLWILYSDKVLLSLFSDPEKLTQIQTYKGWFYVFTASVIIYLLVKREIVKTLLTEKNLKNEQSKYKILFETANDAIFIMDENNIFIDCNRKTLELFKCNREQILGITPIDVSSQFQVNNIESSKLAIERINDARNGVPQRFDWIHTTFDKTKELYTEVSFMMTLISGSKYILAIVRDISDRKLTELELKLKNDEYETLNEELIEKLEVLQATEEEFQASNDELAYINDELRYSEEKYKLLSDLSQEGIFIHNQGVLLEVNKAFCNIFGYKHDELIGIYFPDKIIVSKYVDVIWESIKIGNMGAFSIEGIKKDGTIIWAELEGRDIRYQGQKARVVTVRDVTERKQAENALKESEERYKTVADFTYDWEYWQLPDGKFEYISPSCVEITGYTREEFIKNPLLLDSIIIKEDLESWNSHKENEIIKNEHNKNILKDEETQCELVFRIKTKNGDLKWIGHHCQSIFDKERNYLGKRGSNRDITQQKYAEEQLKLHEEHFRMMVENMPVLINAYDKDGNFIFWNKECEKVTGYKAGEVIGSSKVLDKLYPDPQYKKKKLDLNLDKVFNLEIDLLDRKGDKKTVLWTNINKPVPLKQWHGWEVGIEITNRKKAEQALKESEASLKKAQQIAQIGSWELNFITNSLNWSDEVYKIFGLQPQEFSDTYEAFLEYVHPDDKEQVDKAFTDSVKNRTPYNIVHRILLKDGTVKYVHERCENSYDEKGNVINSIGTVHDITERKKAEVALMESEAKYKTLFLSAGDAALMYQDNKIVDCNERAIKILKASKEEILGLTPWDISPVQQPDGANSKEKALSMINAVFNRNLIEFEWQHINLRNELLDIDVTLSVIDATKNIYISTWRDVTTKKNAQKALQKSEERFRTHYNNMPIPTYTWQQKENDFILVEFNSAAEIATKGSMKNLIGEKLSVIYKDKKDIVTDIITCYKNKKLIQKEMFYKANTTGDKKILDVTYVFVGPNNIVVHTDDITEQKRAENALKESEAKYRLLVENGPSVFWITDKSGKTSYISSNVSNIYGYSPEEIYVHGKELWLDRIHKEEVENVLTNFNRIFTENKQFDVIYRIQAKNGDWIWLHDIGEKYINDDGTELAYGVFTNITVKKQTEQKVLHAMINAEERERSRIAKDLHDGVSPVLSAIKLYIQSMNDSRDVEIKSELSEKINDTIREAIASIKEISNNISPHILQNFGLTRAVESFVDKIRGIKQLNISVESKLTERFSIDIETALYRITTELINNTFKYAKAKNVSIKYFIKGNKVTMEYSDDGIGFNLSQVWKNKIGMGIFNMKNRISALNGQFNITSEPGKGITVDISVPINE